VLGHPEPGLELGDGQPLVGTQPAGFSSGHAAVLVQQYDSSRTSLQT
jgi:hypothetical protein